MVDKDAGLKTPVAFFLFRRPETTRRVWRRIREARPPRLYLIADGGRNDEEWRQCEAARAVIEEPDWPCQVLRNYADKNMGCGRRISSGLDWIFSQENECIILEDDCLPSRSFFDFCERLLDRYRNDERIFHIGGYNPYPDKTWTANSYFGSRYPIIWGWATWRRAWRHYSFASEKWPAFSSSGALDAWLRDPVAERIWRGHFEHGWRTGRTDTWDLQWQLTCWAHGALSIVPRQSLVANVGFGPDATHTTEIEERTAVSEPAEMKLHRHPGSLVPNDRFDTHYLDHEFGGRYQRVPSNPLFRIRVGLSRLLRACFQRR